MITKKRVDQFTTDDGMTHATIADAKRYSLTRVLKSPDDDGSGPYHEPLFKVIERIESNTDTIVEILRFKGRKPRTVKAKKKSKPMSGSSAPSTITSPA